MSSGYQIGNLEPQYGGFTTEEEIKRLAVCRARRRDGACAREASLYSLCADQPAQLDAPAALLPAAQAIIGARGVKGALESLDIQSASSDSQTGASDLNAKNEIALKTLRQEAEKVMLLKIIAVVLFVFIIMYACMFIESFETGYNGGSHHRGRYCSECGGVV